MWAGSYFLREPSVRVSTFFVRPDLRCWFTNRRRCQLRGQRSTGALAGNQLLSNVVLKRDEKTLIDLVDGLSSGSVVLIGVTDDDFTDHDARLEGEATKRLLGHDDHAQAIATTLLVVVKVLLDDDGLDDNQTLSCRTNTFFGRRIKIETTFGLVRIL
jgi:hypothetical protein